MSADMFLDASFAIALSSPPAANHEIAKTLAKRIKAERIRLVTTGGVILEIGNALSKIRYRFAFRAARRNLRTVSAVW